MKLSEWKRIRIYVVFCGVLSCATALDTKAAGDFSVPSTGHLRFERTTPRQERNDPTPPVAIPDRPSPDAGSTRAAQEEAERKEEVESLLEQARAAESRGDLPRAVSLLRDASRKSPDDTGLKGRIKLLEARLTRQKAESEANRRNTALHKEVKQGSNSGLNLPASGSPGGLALPEPKDASLPLELPLTAKSEDGFIASGNAFVGGTEWLIGYNVQSADPAIREKARELYRRQMELSGKHYSGVDFERYNFVIGVAASTDAWTDLRKRVVFDHLRNGNYSRENQEFYNSLKGRKFSELGCHSNGAMVCLAALVNKEIKADRVVLYGPQITPESLKIWNELVRNGQVKSVQILINNNDPIPSVSMLFARGLGTTERVALLQTSSLARTINETAPRIAVRTSQCDSVMPSLDCHSMALYKRNRGCSAPTGRQTIVPGTTLPGRGGVTEPPAPC